MKINVNQIEPIGLTEFIKGIGSGDFSGQFVNYVFSDGYLGDNVVYASGGGQTISGQKTFATSPIVPYSGGTGAATSRKYIDDMDGQTLTLISNFSGNVFSSFSFVKATGSSGILSPNFSGIGGTRVLKSGNFVLVSGGGQSSSVFVTGSDAVVNPNFSGIGGTRIIESGNFVLISGGGSQAANNGDGINLSGNLTQTGASLLSIIASTGQQNSLAATTISGNLTQTGVDLLALLFSTGSNLSAVKVTGSAVMNTVNITGDGGLNITRSGDFVIISGGQGGGTFVESNTYNVTGTGNVYITPTASGDMYNTYNLISGRIDQPISISGITGNFVNMSFFFDEYNLEAGSNLLEGFVSRDFWFTGYALGAYSSGIGGSLSGLMYQRTTLNEKVQILPFSFENGIYFKSEKGYSQVISGMNRVGIDIFSVSTGVTGFTVGIFGVGY